MHYPFSPTPRSSSPSWPISPTTPRPWATRACSLRPCTVRALARPLSDGTERRGVGRDSRLICLPSSTGTRCDKLPDRDVRKRFPREPIHGPANRRDRRPVEGTLPRRQLPNLEERGRPAAEQNDCCRVRKRGLPRRHLRLPCPALSGKSNPTPPPLLHSARADAEARRTGSANPYGIFTTLRGTAPTTRDTMPEHPKRPLWSRSAVV